MPGSYCVAGSVAAALCPAGSYCPDPTTKKACSAGTLCPAGVTAPQACQPGFYCLDSTQKEPTLCPSGACRCGNRPGSILEIRSSAFDMPPCGDTSYESREEQTPELTA